MKGISMLKIKENIAPQKDTKVDFDIGDDGTAQDVYQIRDNVMENNETMMGLLAIGITFFFGFIGTFVARLVLVKQPMEKVIMPTLIHAIISIFIFIPFFGWIIYFIGTAYYMLKNYQLVANNS